MTGCIQSPIKIYLKERILRNHAVKTSVNVQLRSDSLDPNLVFYIKILKLKSKFSRIYPTLIKFPLIFRSCEHGIHPNSSPIHLKPNLHSPVGIWQQKLYNWKGKKCPNQTKKPDIFKSCWLKHKLLQAKAAVSSTMISGYNVNFCFSL